MGKKVYSAFLRAVGRLVGDGGWVREVGCVVEVSLTIASSYPTELKHAVRVFVFVPRS